MCRRRSIGVRVWLRWQAGSCDEWPHAEIPDQNKTDNLRYVSLKELDVRISQIVNFRGTPLPVLVILV